MDETNYQDIEKNFGYIGSVLDTMREENAAKTSNMDKALSNISNQLDLLSDEENANLIKIFLTDLKKTLEEKHNFVSTKFDEIETSFKDLTQKAEGQLKAEEIREVFDIIAGNLNLFAKDFSGQKDVLAQINLQIEELKQDDSQKNEILKNISVLKTDLEKFGNGFESIILNLNTNFKEVSQSLLELDSKEALGNMKKDIESIFLSSNAVLSTLQVIDKKNRELEEIVHSFVTKEDFSLEREQVAKIIEQNAQMAQYISTLPKETNLEALTEKVDTSVGVINALKNMLNESGKQNQELLTAQLENLENRILNISTEEEFIGFRKELSEFADAIIKNSNLMRADLETTNAELKETVGFFNDLEIEEKIEEFAEATKVSEENIKEALAKFSETITKELGKTKNLMAVDLNGGLKDFLEKVEEVKQDLTQNSKLNLSSLSENIQDVVNNLFSVKNALHIENMENAEAIDSKLLEIKENLSASSNIVIQNSQENLENIISNVEKVFEQIQGVKEDLGETATKQVENLAASFNEISKKISEIKGDLKQTSQESFANILSVVEDFSLEISNLKETLGEITQENALEVKGSIENLFEKLSFLQDALTQNAQLNVSDIKGSITELSHAILAAKSTLEQSSSVHYSGLKTHLENLTEELSSVGNNFDSKSQFNLEKIIALFEGLSSEFSTHKEFLSESTQLNFETLSLAIQNLNKNIEEANNDLSEDLKSDLTQMQDSILALPETIKENQVVFENEKRILIEENSKNIQNMNDRVQSLIRGLMAQEVPFKEEVLGEFGTLKSNLEVLKEDLNQSSQALGENVEAKISGNIEKIEEVLAKNSERYSLSLFNLQNKLTDSLEAIQQATEQSDLKLNNSILETFEIKSEIQSILKSLSLLSDDSALSDLSTGIQTRFDDILSNITNLEGIFETRNKSSLQNILASLDENFEVISLNLKKYSDLTQAESNNFALELDEKIEAIKGQINLTGTDILNVLDSRANSIKEIILPISDSVNKILEIDFEQMSSEIKEKIEDSHVSITSVIKECIQNENTEQLEKIEENFAQFNGQIEEFTIKISSDRVDTFNELSAILSQFQETKTAILSEIRNLQNETRVTLTNELENNATTIRNICASTESAISDVIGKTAEAGEEKFFDKIEEVQTSILEGQSANKTIIMDELQGSISTIKNIYSSTESNISNYVEKAFESSDEKLLGRIEYAQDSIIQEQSINKTALLDEFQNGVSLIREMYSSTETSISDTIEDALDSNSEKVFGKIEEVQTSILEGQSSNKTSILDEIQSGISAIKNIYSSTESNISSSVEKTLESSNEKILDRIEYAQDSIVQGQSLNKIALTEELQDGISALKEIYSSTETSISSTVEDALAASDEKVFEKIEEVQTSILEGQSSNKISILEELQNGISSIKEAFSATEPNLSAAIEQSAQSTEEKVFEKIEALKNKLTKIQNETSSIILKELEDNSEFMKESLSSFKLDEDFTKDFTLKIENLQTAFDSTSEEIETILSTSESLYKTSTQALLSDIKTSFYEKVEDNMDDLKSFIEILENKNDLSESLEKLKSDIFDKFSDITDSVEASISTISVKDDLSDLSAEIEVSIENLFKNIQSDLLSLIDDSQTINDITNNSQEIIRRVEDLKNLVNQDIAEKLDLFELNFDNQKLLLEEFKEEFITSLEEFKDTHMDLSINSTAEMSKLLMANQETLDSVEKKVASINIEEALENSLKTPPKEFLENFDVINQKLDLLSLEDDSEIEENVQKIKQLISSQAEFFKQLEKLQKLDALSGLKGLDKLDQLKDLTQLSKLDGLDGLSAKLQPLEKLSRLDEIPSIKTGIQSTLKSFDTKLDEICKKGADTKEIEKKLATFKDELFENILEIFNQISFVVEAEEIKDFVEEKSDEIKTSLGNNFKDILSSLDNLHDKTNKIKSKIELSNGGIKESEVDSDYSYTLQDVESDIAKLRLVLDDIAKTKVPVESEPLGDVDTINENLLSISTRTNKLLLTSDESYNVLKDNLSDFKNIIYQLEERIKYIDNTEKIGKIEKTLDKVNNLTLSCVKSDKIFNQTFMYLAEWVDDASESLANITEKVADIDSVKISVMDLKKTMPKKSDIEEIMIKISEKFDSQQSRIDSLEEKLDRILSESDTKGLKPEAKLNKKIDNIDKQLAKLGSHIEKLASYVEE